MVRMNDKLKYRLYTINGEGKLSRPTQKFSGSLSSASVSSGVLLTQCFCFQLGGALLFFLGCKKFRPRKLLGALAIICRLAYLRTLSHQDGSFSLIYSPLSIPRWSLKALPCLGSKVNSMAGHFVYLLDLIHLIEYNLAGKLIV